MKMRTMLVSGIALMTAFAVEAKKKPSLKWPVQYNNVAKVQELLGQGADANEKDGGTPMMCIAANFANSDMLKLLVSKGAEVDAKNMSGMSALCCLSLSAKEPEEMVKDNTAGNEKVLEAYRKRGNEAAAKEWLMPTDPSAYSTIADRAKTLVELGANPNFVWADELTPFLQAVESRNISLAKALLATGKVDTELRFHQWVEKVVGIVKFIDVGKYVKGDRKTAQEWAMVPQYNTPLLFAAEKGDLELVTALVESGAQVNNGKKMQEGSTFWMVSPLDVAIKKGHTAVAEYLKSKGGVEVCPNDCK